jgi:flagellar basal-body rod modification protein FlgD
MAVSSIDSLMNPNEKARVAPQKTMGQADFLKLLTTQMQNQDPTNPVDNTKMIADMAQFSSLEAMKQLNDTVSSMSQMFKTNQAVQASVLVGKDVVVPGSTVNLISGTAPVALVNIEESLTDVKAQIRNASGELVREYSWESLPQGQGDLKWDGKDASGNALPQGSYTVTAWGTNSEGARAAVGTLVAQKVVSVDVGSSGASLNLADGSAAGLDEIQQIR